MINQINKLGLIFEPVKQLWWQQSHAQNPFPIQISEHVFRVYFASRDHKNVSRTGWFDLDMRNVFDNKQFSEKPILDIGKLGMFDDCGAMAHSIIKNNENEFILYYTGWSKAVSVPFTFYIGAAKSKNLNEPFERISEAPILGRNYFDPLLTCAPFVTKEKDNFLMQYISGLSWEIDEQTKQVKHYYTAKSATSIDGINWETNDKILIELENEEYAIARPVLFMNDNMYEIWFSYRGGKNSYRIGKMVGTDLNKLHRVNVNLAVGSEGDWDSEMVCYAYPFKYNNEVYILYNGNSYGSTGIGLAKIN